ncbi:beta-lactamase family protein [Aggregatimonas sangjinii]|uniref:Beta-lactamase family protein n=1 Tax=Aggregatimonas sangjinii TaxID=2583587 RepID=A0A5B7SSP1_9FLAO|nr:serine hydrolase domain-containing protein [Aggregatimonas sangjinii]QCX01547.1 beta-lactamase family protein [Aggregatimonas sangjinii]
MKMFAKPLPLTVAFFFMALFTASCQDVMNDTSIEKSIDTIFKAFDHPNKPGAAVAVVQNGEIVFKKGYGSANLEYDIPVTPKTIFHVASVSKQFTVFALLLLAEEGKLSFDDPIQKYIEEVPDFGQEITLRHLAAHTSGMRDQWDLLNLAGWRWDDVITKEHILKMVSRQKELNFTPGEQFMYCNTGYTLLAEVVARVSGKSFAVFTQERIFTPLQMTNSQFYDDHTKIVKNRAYSYNPMIYGFQKSVLSYANVGATSLFTTVEDLSLWAMNFKEPKVGSADLIEQMNTLAVLNNGKTFNGAYGQFVTPYKGLQQIQHSGGDAGYRSYLTRFPDQGLAVSVVSNSGASNPYALGMQVVDLYLKDAFVEEQRSQPDQKEVKTISLSETALQAFEGHYWDAKDLYSRRIYLKDGRLQYDRGNGNVTELAPLTESTFRMRNLPNEVTVAFSSEDGQARMIVSEGDNILGTLDAYTPVDASKVDLTPFLGPYTSEELSTTYTLIENEGKLIATHPRSSDIPLTLIKADVYKAGGNTIVFTRDGDNTVQGLKVSTGRVKNLKFSKE